MKLKLAITAVLMSAGCITVNVPLGTGETGPSYQWLLRWEAPHAGISRTFSSPVRVRDFEGSGSYQLSGMVLERADGSIRESSDNRWAARPGAMLGEMLARDLQAAGGFPAVFRTAASVNEIVTVEGYVRQFGAVQKDSTTWTAVFDVDVTLMGSRGSEIIFQKNYSYTEDLPAPGFRELAEALSNLSEMWSEQVRADLYSHLSN